MINEDPDFRATQRPLFHVAALADGYDPTELELGDAAMSEELYVEYEDPSVQAAFEGWLLCAAQEPVSAWQPIETAPKDGTSVLGYWLGGQHDCAIHATKFHRGRWWEPNEDYPQSPPTHWQPLPEAPK